MSKTIKIHTALKLKNRMAGEVARIQRLVCRENSRRSDSSSKVDVAELFTQLSKARANLALIKGAIAQANVAIYDKLAALAEAKAYMAFLPTIPTREGEEKDRGGMYSVGEGKTEVYQWTAHLNQAALDAALVETQTQINTLQDEIDAHNAGASITVALS